MLESVTAHRYVTPLREGGSLPAIVDTEPPGPYVVKFRGAGQGPKALIAEALAAGLASELGLPLPKPAIVTLGDAFGMSEPDPEIQDLLRASVGSNFGLAYLPGAIGFDAAVDANGVTPELAAEIVWFDAFIMNPDRTPRNPNLLVWQNRVWLIDHGASFYFHHRTDGWESRVQSATPQIKDHILLARTGDLRAADARLRPRLTEAVIRQVVAGVPAEWLAPEQSEADVVASRDKYAIHLLARLAEPRSWLTEAINVQSGR